MTDTSLILKKITNASYIRYLLVGGTAFVVDYGTLLVLNKILAVNIAAAAIIGFSAGFIVSFALNRGWAFSGGEDRNGRKQLIEYSLLVVFNLIFTAVALSALESVVSVAILKPVIVVIITVWNYLVYNRIIFRTTDEKE